MKTSILDQNKSSKNNQAASKTDVSFFGKTTKTDFFSPATIQPKLTIGQPNDKYEQEADAMAERVVNNGQSDNAVSPGSAGIQRACADCEKEKPVRA